MKNTKVISIGGSIIAPDEPDVELLRKLVNALGRWLAENENGELVLIAGGGGPARAYQAAYRDIEPYIASGTDIPFFKSQDKRDAEDWIGVMATRLNAELLRACFGRLAPFPVVTDPSVAPDNWHGRILVAAGWKPGFSSDNDAVLLAEKYGAKEVINLSNIDYVYDKDPKKNPDAKPLEHISWADFCAMVGDKWVPGMNAPFDPIASKRAAKLGLTVICASGHDIDNLRLILDNGDYRGTTITT